MSSFQDRMTIMIKKHFIAALLPVVMLALGACASGTAPEPTGIPESEATTSVQVSVDLSTELRAVWISYNELSMSEQGGGTEESFRQKVCGMLNTVSSLGLNTVIVHARAFSDAFYRSELFPFSKYLTGEEGKDPGYDPLKIMVEEAHSRSLEIHAWINPYRVSYDTDFAKLSDLNPAKKWHNEKREKDTRLILCESGIYYNPADSEAQKLIIDGIREIVENYEIDGIHYDDYFYPATAPEIDAVSYQQYRDTGGKYELADWRRENVNNFVSGVYSAVKACDPSVQVGISPSANQDYNYNKMYADTALWAGNSGYCDYIMPQVYYGFDNETLPFERTVVQWEKLCESGKVKLYFGLAFYKCGEVDTYASASEEAGSARYEWQRSSDIIARQIRTIRSLPHYGGYALFSYASVSSPGSENAKAELENYLAVVSEK